MKKRSKFVSLVLLLSLITGSLFAQTSTDPDAVIGNFKGPDGDRTMEIFKDKGMYFGKLTNISGNKGEPKVGTVFLKNFIFKSGKWEGKVYIPAKKTDYDATLTLRDDNLLVIKVKVGFISRSKTWSRIQ